MRNSLILTIISLVFSSTCLGQDKGPKYTHYFKDVAEPLETKEVNIEFSNGISRADFLKFKAKYINNTNDFLFVDPSKTELTLGARTITTPEKSFILDPMDSKSKTVDVKEGADFVVDRFMVEPKGFSRIPADGEAIELPDFQLPAAVNNISGKNVEINLKRVKQETKETWATFSVKYTGDHYAIVDPSRISVRLESGQQFANDFSKSKNILLEKGDSKNIRAVFHIPARIVDMQFATMFIQWGATVTETKPIPIDLGETVTFELDEELTEKKN